MKLRLDLKSESKAEWLDCVLNNFEEFLRDHADCERKVSSMAMSFVAKFPDRIEIIPELIEIAIEELEHFQLISNLLLKRNIDLPNRIKSDLYVKGLVNLAHSGREERFLDRLLIASVIETRAAERFRLIANGLSDPEYKTIYSNLWTAEARHGEVFVKMALNYFDDKRVFDRLEWWGHREAEVMDQQEITPCLH